MSDVVDLLNQHQEALQKSFEQMQARPDYPFVVERLNALSDDAMSGKGRSLDEACAKIIDLALQEL